MEDQINGHEKPKALLVILMSPCDDRGNPTTWQALKPDEVPAWISDDPDVIANLMAGEMCQNKLAPLAWYRAEQVTTNGVRH